LGETVPEFGTFENMVEFRTLYNAHRDARRGKGQVREVLAFELDLAANLVELGEELATGEYEVGPYSHFVVLRGPRRRAAPWQPGVAVVRAALPRPHRPRSDGAAGAAAVYAVSGRRRRAVP
jgi:hypothetical protein